MNRTGFAMGIDLGGTTTKVALLDSAGELVAGARTSTGDHSDIHRIISTTSDLVLRTVDNFGISMSDCTRVGVALPAEIAPGERQLARSPILRNWQDVPVAREFEARLGQEVRLVNDANAALAAEIAAGNGSSRGSTVLLTIGTGIGGGVAIDNRVLFGSCGSAGEFGHMVVARNGARCACGRRGCLGVMASTSALLRYFVDAGGEPGTGLDGRQLSVLLKNGHPAAIKAFSRMSRYLALGVSDICSAIAPHRIIFSGGLVEGIGYGLLQALHDSLVSFSYPRIQRQVDLVCGILGDDAGAIGATLVQTNDSP